MDPENNEYSCPECKGQFSFDLAVVDESQSKVSSCTESNDQSTLPNKIIVVCKDVEGIYYPNLHLIQCKCGSCGTRKKTPSEWERHTGSRAKKWKVSVNVKDSMLPLEKMGYASCRFIRKLQVYKQVYEEPISNHQCT